MDDNAMQQAKECLAKCLSYAEVQHAIFYHVQNAKPVFVDKLFKLIKQAPNGTETMAQLMTAEDNVRRTVLMVSAGQGELALCEMLVAEGADVNQHNEERPTALVLSAQRGHTTCARFLLEHSVSEESKNLALIPAAHCVHLEVVRLLLEFGADSNYSNKRGTTPLMRAAQEGRNEMVQFLFDKGARVDVANNEGMTALMLTSQRGHASVAAILINAGSNVNTQTGQGSTSLLLAAKRGHLETVEVLLAAKADIFIKDCRQRTAAECAHGHGHEDVVRAITTSMCRASRL